MDVEFAFCSILKEIKFLISRMLDCKLTYVLREANQAVDWLVVMLPLLLYVYIRRVAGLMSYDVFWSPTLEALLVNEILLT